MLSEVHHLMQKTVRRVNVWLYIGVILSF